MEVFEDLTSNSRGSFAKSSQMGMPGKSHDSWVDAANKPIKGEDIEEFGPKQFGMPGELQRTKPTDPNVAADLADLLARSGQLPKED